MLFCLSATYTPKALEAMGKNPSNRREAVEKLLTAAGGKLVAMYGTIAEGPGAMAIFDQRIIKSEVVAGHAGISFAQSHKNQCGKHECSYKKGAA